MGGSTVFLEEPVASFTSISWKKSLESVLCKGSVMLVAPTQHQTSTLILCHDLIYHPCIVCRSVFTCTSRWNRVLWLQKVGGESTYQNQTHRRRRNKRFRPDACNVTQHGAFAVSSKKNLLLSTCWTVDVWQVATELNTLRCFCVLSVYCLCCMLQRIKLHCFELLSIGVSRSSVDVTVGTTGEAIDREVSGTWRPAERLVLQQRWRRFISKTAGYAIIHCHWFNDHKLYVLPTQCIYVFCVDLRTNSDYFPIQH